MGDSLSYLDNLLSKFNRVYIKYFIAVKCYLKAKFDAFLQNRTLLSQYWCTMMNDITSFESLAKFRAPKRQDMQ